MLKLPSSIAVVALGVSFLPVTTFGADSPANPLEQVTVSATRSGDAVRTDTLGSSITVLEPVDLANRQTRMVSDILRDVPGVAVNRAGAVGGQTQIRIRGSESNHVLVLIDGIEAADPNFGEFDFATLLADQIARVEVLRGQQSALYGSDAIGGVIHYITATGREQPGLQTRIEGGSFNTWEGALRYGGATDTVDYAFSAGYQTTDGTPTSLVGSRDLGADNTMLTGKVNFTPTDTFRVKAVARYSYTKADINDQDFGSPFATGTYGYVIDTSDYFRNRAFYGLVRAELDSFDSAWRNAISLQSVDAARDGYNLGGKSYGDDGSRLKGSYESTLKFGSDAVAQTFTAAVDFEREEIQNTGPFLTDAQALQRRIDNTGLVAQYDVVIDERIGLGAALRYDDNDRFDNDTTYRVQASYRFDSGTRLRAAAGSGIKNPSVTELFGFDPDTFVGNPNLKPERSQGWEAGIEQKFGEVALLGATYFDSKLQDEIFTVFGAVSRPINLATDSSQKGVEVFATTSIGRAWKIDASYTHLDAKQNGIEEVRRPPNIGSLNVDWRVIENAGLNLTIRYNGEMTDSNFTGRGPSPIALSEYTLVNLGGDYSFTDRLGIYARVENLFDEEYEEIYTYKAPGRAAYFGVKASF